MSDALKAAGGVKFDEGKARFDLLPPEPLEALAALYAYGAQKYADRNWEKGMSWGRVFAAMMRHAWKFWRGQDYDDDPRWAEMGVKVHHLTAVAWGAFALYTYFVRRLGEDTRSAVVSPDTPTT
jgi:hypothetical protein